MKLSLRLDHESLPPTPHHKVRALLTVDGTAPSAESRTPLNISMVLDRSGSMAGERLDAAKDAAALLLRRLWPDDVASVVTFDGEVDTFIAPAKRSDAPGATEMVRRIQAGGATNLSGGWLRGRELLTDGRTNSHGDTDGNSSGGEGPAARLILLTDGHANQGVTNPTMLAKMCASARQSGVTTTTIGIGEGFDHELMRTMADAGGGNTYYIENPDQAPAIFDEEVGNLLSLSAQNVRVEILLLEGASLAAVYHTYPSEELDGGSSGLRLELGDLYASDPPQLLVEFLVDPGSGDAARTAMDTPAGATAPVAVATLVVTADVLTPEGGIQHQIIQLPITFSPAEGPIADPEIVREVLIQSTAKARKDALEAYKTGDAKSAIKTLRAVAKECADYEPDDERIAEEATDLAEMADGLEASGMTMQDEKYLYQRSYDAGRSKSESWMTMSRSMMRDLKAIEDSEDEDDA